MAEHKYTELDATEIENALRNRKRGIESDLLASEANLIGLDDGADRERLEARVEKLKKAANEIVEKLKKAAG